MAVSPYIHIYIYIYLFRQFWQFLGGTQDPLWETPLLTAAHLGNLKLVRILLEAGARRRGWVNWDVIWLGHRGTNPLKMAEHIIQVSELL